MKIIPKRRWGFGTLLGLVALFGLAYPTQAEDKKSESNYGKPKDQNVSVMPPEWKSVTKTRLTATELDSILGKEQKADKLRPSPRTTDEQFVRRVYLDLTGKLPPPAEVKAFVASTEPGKRSKLIDKLLATEDFSHFQARYWKDVVSARATDQRVKAFGDPVFEKWLFTQFQENKSWSQMARAMLTAHGFVSPVKTEESNGASYFLLTSSGADGPQERAAETSRIFLGIQIQCAQCHDHPGDIWKQRQFHELTAFFARTRERPLREVDPKADRTRPPRIIGIELVSLPRGEHRMPDTKDPKKTTLMEPKFLDGQSPRFSRLGSDRRESLADWITSKENYWFSAAFVNRVWGELMGQGFYQPVDDMGPLRQATYPQVLLRVAAHFNATDYNIRDLYRLIMNSEAYQRQIRLGDSGEKHLHFAAIYPTRLRADAIWDSLVNAVGPLQFGPMQRPGPGGGAGPLRRPLGFEAFFKATFAFDPSMKPDDVEGTIPQALMLMNNPGIQGRMSARGNTVLAKILANNSNDAQAVQAVYLQVLARKPTSREQQTCLDYIKSIKNRNEAYEDLYWTLLNSTEFLTKR
jgi:hypothetical protein